MYSSLVFNVAGDAENMKGEKESMAEEFEGKDMRFV